MHAFPLLRSYAPTLLRSYALTLLLSLAALGASASLTNNAVYHLGEAGSIGAAAPYNPLYDSATAEGAQNITNYYNGGATVSLVNSGLRAAGSTAALKVQGGDNDTYYGGPLNLGFNDNFGMEIWVKPDANQLTGNHDLFTTTSTATQGLKLGLYTNWVALINNTIFSLGPAAVADQWMTLAIIRSNGVSTFYVNGVPQPGTTSTAPTVNKPTLFNHNPTGDNNPFKGILDEARFFTFNPATDNPAATLSTLPLVPWIDTQPVSATNFYGSNQTFSVVAGGVGTLSYQWLHNSGPAANGNSATLSLTNLQSGDGGSYQVIISNNHGAVTSSIVTLFLYALPTYPMVMKSLGPAAYWRFGETSGTIAYDVMGTNNGTYANATPGQLPGAIVGEDDGAMATSGAGSHMTLSDASAFNYSGAPSFSLVAWVRPDSLPDNARSRIFSNRDQYTGTGYAGFGFGFFTNASLTFTAFGLTDVNVLSTPFELGVWYHLACTITNGTVTFYTNGVLAAAGTASTIYPSGYPLTIGANSSFLASTDEEPFIGEIDEAAIFSRALTADEIATLYAAAFAPAVPPLVVVRPPTTNVPAGSTVTFTSAASGSGTLAYQWHDNLTNPIAGATGTTLTLTNLQPAQSGNYTLVVTNDYGVGSAFASLTVNSVLVAPTLSNWSALSGGAFRLTFTGPSSQTFDLLGTTNVALPLANWLVLTNGTFNGTAVTFTDASPGASRKFYRIRSPHR